jgi:hypothetical protein
MHIKLDLMRQFVVVLDKDGNSFKYIYNKFQVSDLRKLKNELSLGVRSGW